MSKRTSSTYSLIGVNSNAFTIMGYVLRAMRDCKMPVEEQAAYQKDAMSSDYNHLLNVSNDMISLCNTVNKKAKK